MEVGMVEGPKSEYERIGLRAVRPYLIVNNADEAIDLYRRVFEAAELERHTTPAGGVAHAKLQVGETIIEIGEHPDAIDRDVDCLPRVGLRLYVTDVDETYARAGGRGQRRRSLKPPPRITYSECLRSVRPHVVARGDRCLAGCKSGPSAKAAPVRRV